MPASAPLKQAAGPGVDQGGNLPATDKVKVLFIAGNGRSGSTLLDIVLGQLQGFFAVGELRRIWDRGLIENRFCGCHEPFRQCPTWLAVFDQAYGGMNAIDAEEMVRYREAFTQTKHLPGMLIGRPARRSHESRLQPMLDNLESVYGAIQSTTGCRVIVDSSKWPTYAYFLGLLPSVELYLLHLVRDPRAIAFSWSRKKYYEPNKLMPRQSALKSTLYWLAWNIAIPRLWSASKGRYMLLPYESFIPDPQGTIARVLRFVEEEPQVLPFVDDTHLPIEPTHAVAGNETRLSTGSIAFKFDDEWETRMPRASKHLVSAMTWPMLRRYRYTSRSRPSLQPLGEGS